MSCRTSDRAGHDIYSSKPRVTPAAPIIPCSSVPELSNNIIQKGLAFDRDWSGTVVNPGSQRRPRDPAPPASWPSGASVVRRDAAINRTEDLNVKVCEEAVI